jgi:hypothetical protein
LVYYIATGDLFHRFRSMLDFSKNHLIDKDGENYIRSGVPSGLLEWLVYQLGYIFLLVFSIPAFLWLKKKDCGFLHFILFYSTVLFAETVLLCQTDKFGIVFMQARLWMFLVPSLSIVAAGSIALPDRRLIFCVLGIFLFLCAYAYVYTGLKRMCLFAVFTIAIGTYGLFLHKTRYAFFAILIPFLILAGGFVYSNSSWGKYKRIRGTELILPGKFPLSDRHIQVEVLLQPLVLLRVVGSQHP